MSDPRRTNRRRGFSLIELLIVITIIGILLTMAMPQFNKVLMHTRETAAMTAVQTVRDMQIQYQGQYGRFAKTLAELGPPPGGGAASSPAAAGLIPTDLASGVKGGYNFAVTGDGTGYVVTATPITYGTSGSRSFYMDQNMVMKEHYGPEPATNSDKELGQNQK
jgi:type IV pilus assembly protein PilA